MYYLFEKSDSLNMPIECFVFDTALMQFPIRPHWHYFAEVIYVLEGSAEMHADDKSYILSEGDLLLFHPKSVHSIFSLNSDPLKYSVLKFDVNKINIAAVYAPKLRSILKSAAAVGMPICFRLQDTVGMDCERIFSDCMSELAEQKYGYDQVIRTRIYALLMNIIRKWLECGFAIDNEAFENDSDCGIEGVTEYIDGNIKESLQVADIAKRCGLSYSCFAKKFSSLYGMSCKAYIEKMRIFKVEDFLLFTDFDLNYISQETGFSDCSHMIKSFRKYRGCTPKQFRMKSPSASGGKAKAPRRPDGGELL